VLERLLIADVPGAVARVAGAAALAFVVLSAIAFGAAALAV
jgi:hypothetical protein